MNHLLQVRTLAMDLKMLWGRPGFPWSTGGGARPRHRAGGLARCRPEGPGNGRGGGGGGPGRGGGPGDWWS